MNPALKDYTKVSEMKKALEAAKRREMEQERQKLPFNGDSDAAFEAGDSGAYFLIAKFKDKRRTKGGAVI